MKDRLNDQEENENARNKLERENERLFEKLNKVEDELKDVGDYSNVMQIREENLIMCEKLSQCEEELSKLKFSDERKDVELVEKLKGEKKELEMKVKDLEARLAESSEWNEEMIEGKVKGVVKELERKMLVLRAEHGEELDTLRDSQAQEMA